MSSPQHSRRSSNGIPLSVLAEKFFQRMQLRNFAASTIKLRRDYLGQFLMWLDERGITQIGEVTRDVLLAYQRSLYHYRIRRTGKPLKFSTQLSRLIPVRSWFRFLLREQLIAHNPASDLDFPKEEQRLPGQVLTADQVEAILQQPDVTTALGLRDRAMLETLYSTAMRRSELIHLTIYDLDLARRLVMIRQGKGAKDRNVPIGKRALCWVTKYRDDVRPELAERTGTNVLFVSRSGRPWGPSNLSILVRDYIRKAGITQPGSCHLFRHAASTLMLDNGADIRYLQELLGHAELTTTQIYTRVTVQRLREVHDATHPADLPRPEQPEQLGSSAESPLAEEPGDNGDEGTLGDDAPGAGTA